LTEAVGLGTLLAGYQQAYNRWMAGPRIDTDPDQAFFGIFEALNWAVVVDNRLKETLLGWPGGYDGRDYLIGFRYARNAVHHDWAEALWLDRRGAVLPAPLPSGCLSGAGNRGSAPPAQAGSRSTAPIFQGSLFASRSRLWGRSTQRPPQRRKTPDQATTPSVAGVEPTTKGQRSPARRTHAQRRWGSR
jgi:hypothetical protein